MVPKKKEEVVSVKKTAIRRASSRLAVVAGKKRARREPTDVHRPKPGGSAFQNDCGILPSE
jgi:hypothetical protein